MLNSLKNGDFVKQFIAACSFEQKDINWVKAYWDFYPYESSYRVKIAGQDLDADVERLKFEEGFDFSIPKGLKEEMENFRWRVREMMGLFSEGTKIEILLSDVVIDMNDKGITGVDFAFKFSLSGDGSVVYGNSMKMILKWRFEEKKKEESNVRGWNEGELEGFREIEQSISALYQKVIN